MLCELLIMKPQLTENNFLIYLIKNSAFSEIQDLYDDLTRVKYIKRLLQTGGSLDVMEEKQVSFEVAKSMCSAKTVFTTHTPVPAGNDIFPLNLIEKYFKDCDNL